MKKLLLCMLCLLLYAGIAFTQTKPKPPVKQVMSEMKKLFVGSTLPYNMINDSVAVIPYNGINISSYEVVVQKLGGLYIIYTNISEALPGKIDASKYKYLLQKNDHFDIIKIGMSADDDIVYVRADVYKAGLTATLMERIIKQVANVSNIIAGDLK
jgi:hypothetical protein